MESERELREPQPDNSSAAYRVVVGEYGDGVGSDTTPPQKKPKRLCNYRAEWSAEFTWCLKVAGNVLAADCKLCRKTVSIGHGSRSDLIQHSKTEGHKKAVRGATTTSVRKGGGTPSAKSMRGSGCGRTHSVASQLVSVSASWPLASSATRLVTIS